VKTVRYLGEIPREPLPSGYVVVHNHVRPQSRLGARGFRAWVAAGDDAGDHRSDDPYEVERCDCGWAPELPEHYRVVRDAGPGRPE
jgi:hypothetical protein